MHEEKATGKAILGKGRIAWFSVNALYFFVTVLIDVSLKICNHIVDVVFFYSCCIDEALENSC